jgi:hypothetical protein
LILRVEEIADVIRKHFVQRVEFRRRTLLARQIGNDLGEADSVLVFDPSAFAKKGTKSVGVVRSFG